MKKARTIRLITGSRIPPIPLGTEFEVTYESPNLPYVSCKGLPIDLIWKEEFEYLPEPSSVPAPDAKPSLCVEGQRIFKNVLAAMQDAEEIGGPEDEDYVALMKCIAAEAIERVSNFRSHTPEIS